MRIGYIVIAVCVGVVAAGLAIADNNHWWIPAGVAVAMLVLGLDQKRHEKRMDVIYTEHFGRPYERHRGWF
jgi:hypothetical protein